MCQSSLDNSKSLKTWFKPWWGRVNSCYRTPWCISTVQRKRFKYTNIKSRGFIMIVLRMETGGIWCKEGKHWVKSIGENLRWKSVVPKILLNRLKRENTYDNTKRQNCIHSNLLATYRGTWGFLECSL